MLVTDQQIDALAEEFLNGSTALGTPFYAVMTFDEFISRKQQALSN